MLELLKKTVKLFLPFLSVILLLSGQLYSQRIVDKNKGNHNFSKKGFMDGNLVYTVYYNYGEVADWENEPSRSGVWPKGTNHTYVDGVAIIVQAEAKDPAGKLIHPLETNYYEYTRIDPVTKVTYGWWPLPGYYHPTMTTSPAQSSDPGTWPLHWPDRPNDWDGKWNGFFGKGVMNADLECYFVMDDDEDREYILKNRFHPDADDSSRGGLGMQVHARGFQWSQVLAADVIFWYYEITNMGTYDYNKALFAQYVDWGIGGHDNSSNNAGDYDEQLDISYAWSIIPFGSPGRWSPVGLSGYAFLESPGISDDRSDNDEDGLTNEKRDNPASTFITTPAQDPFISNILTDTLKFKSFYGYSWRPHWDADENANWRSYTDVNKNGSYDQGEPLNDDVGTDGIGPYDENYTEEDQDGTEGNNRPDQGEPNFGLLDKDESDQLGLTGFLIFPTHTPYDLDNDEENWKGLSSLPAPHGQSLVGVNLANFFSSYFIHLFGRNTYSAMTGSLQETGETERFSMSLLFALDKQELFRRKRTVQQIYNANYRFAKPPEKPIVRAIPGDGKVTLYWDDRAEQTFDAFYQRYNFEGYKIYRSTESNFLENRIVTDAYGSPTFRKALATFDVIDNIKGLHPVTVAGASFDLGEDSGLQHSYTDTTVQNGQTYFYAVVAYDKGFTDTSVTGEFIGIPPTETTSIIKSDISGYKTDINTAVVTPSAPAAGYVESELQGMLHVGPATGNVAVDIVDPDSLKDNHLYRVEFFNDSRFNNLPNPSYILVDHTAGDTLVPMTKLKGEREQTLVLDGFSATITNNPTVSIRSAATGWTKGTSTDVVKPGFDPRYEGAYQSKKIFYPADFEIRFFEAGQGDTSFPASTFLKGQPSNIVVKNLTENIDHAQFIFRDNNKDQIFNAGDAVFFVVGDSAGKRANAFVDARITWSVTLETDTTLPVDKRVDPKAGDVFVLSTTKPFRSGEYVEFTAKKAYFNQQKAKTELSDIAVVPNPYVGAASWEPVTSTVGRGERKINFIHLPAECTIKIFTMAGRLVQEIEHRSNIANGQESWNLVSRDGMDIAYGVYIYVVEAPGLGTRIDRFAIIK